MEIRMLNIKIPRDLSLLLQLLKLDFKLEDISNILVSEDIQALFQKHRVLSNIPKSALEKLLSSEILIQLDDSARKAKIFNLTMLAEMIRLSRKLNKNNVAYVFLKGIPLSAILFKDPLIRHAKDLDIWIRQSDLDIMLDIMQEMGYKVSTPSYKLEGFKKDYYLKHKHDISLFNEERHVEIELHFKLSSSYYDFKFFDITNTQLISLEFSGTCVMIMDHNYNFLYLILHGSKHAWFRLKWLYDIYLYLQTGLIDLPKVFSLAKELKLEIILLQTLALLKLLFNFENEETKNILVKNNNKRVLYITKKALEIIISKDDVGILNNPLNKTALRYRLYLFYLTIASSGTTVHFKYFIDAFFQIDILFEKITFNRNFSFMYYIVYPFAILHIIINHLRGKFNKQKNRK